MLLSLVIPVYNEQESLPLLLESLKDVVASLDTDYEILFVDDGSHDRSRNILERAAFDNPRIRLLGFSRNFGHQAALTAGLDFASGDAVVTMDADMQDPPDLLPEMLRLYREGFDVVSPQRVSRHGDSAIKRLTARLFYGLMRTAVDKRLKPEVGDFRLYSRAALVALGSLREEHRFLRGMVAWLGLHEAVVPFHRGQRTAGETKYPLHRMIRLAWTAITSFSAFPLQICFYLGLAVSLAGFSYLLFILAALYAGETVQGWASLGSLQIIFSGTILIAVGLLGDYIARIYEQGKSRPLYIIDCAANVDMCARDVPRAVFLPARRQPSR